MSSMSNQSARVHRRRRGLQGAYDGCGGCQNYGVCVSPAFSNVGNAVVDPSSTTIAAPSCDCRGTGFVGELCESPCDLDCMNGGKCRPAPEAGGSPTCGCSRAVVGGKPYAGLRCEYGAERLCMVLGSESKHSFCTNGGECADIVGDNQRHVPCVCGPGFEGDRCQYVEGTAPRDVSAATTSETEAGAINGTSSANDKVMMGFIGLFGALIVILLLAFFVRGRRRRAEQERINREVKEATEELAMMPTYDNSDHDNRGIM